MLVQFDLGDIETAWAAACRELARGCVQAVIHGVADGATAALSTGRWRDRTGETRSKTRGIVETITTNGAAGELHSLVKWASYLEDGTRPHEIRPKAGSGEMGPLLPGQSRRAKTDIGTHRVALRWFDDGGAIHFARVVHHPGTQPTGYMNEGFTTCARVMIDEVEAGVANAQHVLDSY
jgi:hypothetical protein